MFMFLYDNNIDKFIINSSENYIFLIFLIWQSFSWIFFISICNIMDDCIIAFIVKIDIIWQNWEITDEIFSRLRIFYISKNQIFFNFFKTLENMYFLNRILFIFCILGDFLNFFSTWCSFNNYSILYYNEKH